MIRVLVATVVVSACVVLATPDTWVGLAAGTLLIGTLGGSALGGLAMLLTETKKQ